MKRAAAAILCAVLLLAPACAAFAQADDCMPTYYRAKNAACLEATLTQMREAVAKSPNTNFGFVGFLAAAFQSSPETRTKVLAEDATKAMKIHVLAALMSAGQTEEGRAYAEKNQLGDLFAQLDAEHWPTIQNAKPRSTPELNDLLIGAFMASGDTAFLKSILDNFATAEGDADRDAVRLSLMNSKFAKNDPRGGFKAMTAATCEKYQCKRDPAQFKRILTLSSAYWALNSLGSKDDTIRKTYDRFLADHRQIKTTFVDEEQAFANYMKIFVFLTAAERGPDPKQRQPLTDALSRYEGLGPGQDLTQALQKAVANKPQQ